tara:strand:+ start:15932 stop:17035 length:1104 start_codon:yes stop_codon:yes gene_type:complete
MNIGIDARTAFLNKKGGFGVYTRNLIIEMASLYTEHSFDLKFHKKIEHQIRGFNNINHKKLSFPLNTLWTQLRLPIHFINYKPDVFLFPSQSICRFSPSKKVVTIHDLRFKAVKHHNNSEYLRLDLQIKNCIKHSDQIICVSKQTKSDLIKYYSVDDSKINVIYHGADHFPEIKKGKDGIKKDLLLKKYNLPKNFLLTVGFTMKHKNIISAVKCLNELINSGHEIQLVIVGPKGDDEKNIINKIHKLNLRDKVIRIPYVDFEDLPYFYYYSKLFLYPSFYEGFGFPILEAMRSGAVVLGGNVGSIPEIGGNAMYYFDPNNFEDMVNKTKEVLSDKEMLNNLRSAGYKRAKYFKWCKTAKDTFEVLQS